MREMTRGEAWMVLGIIILTLAALEIVTSNFKSNIGRIEAKYAKDSIIIHQKENGDTLKIKDIKNDYTN